MSVKTNGQSHARLQTRPEHQVRQLKLAACSVTKACPRIGCSLTLELNFYHSFPHVLVTLLFSTMHPNFCSSFQALKGFCGVITVPGNNGLLLPFLGRKPHSCIHWGQLLLTHLVDLRNGDTLLLRKRRRSDPLDVCDLSQHLLLPLVQVQFRGQSLRQRVGAQATCNISTVLRPDRKLTTPVLNPVFWPQRSSQRCALTKAHCFLFCFFLRGGCWPTQEKEWQNLALVKMPLLFHPKT